MEPYFHQRLATKDGKIVPNREKLRPPLEFRIIGWSVVENYRIVFFQEGYLTGEYLYRDKEPIAITDGNLAIYTKEGSPDPPRGAVNMGNTQSMNKVDWRVGQHGVPSAIASALRDPINQTWIIRPEQAGFKDYEPSDEG
jgi:hypothetical protein